MTDDKEISLKERIAQLEQKVGTNTPPGKKVKEFKLPWSVRMKLKRAQKNNKVLVIYLRENREVQFKFGTIDNGTLKFGEKVYDASQAFVYNYKRIAVYIIPEWSTSPFGDVDYAQAVEDGRMIHSQVITIRAIQAAIAQLPKGGFNSILIWVGVGIAVIVVGYWIFNGIGGG